MKIVIFSASLDACGPVNVLYNMVEAYSHNRRDVEFVMLTLSDALKDSRVADFEKMGIKTTCLHINNRYKVLFRLKLVKQAVLNEKPDVLHVSGYRAEIIAALLRLPNVKKVASIFNFPFEDYVMLYGKMMGSFMAYTSVYNYKWNFDITIPCSWYIVSKFKKKYNEFPFKYEVVHTGVPEDVFIPLPAEERKMKKAQLGIPENKNVYLYCAILIPRKNPEMVVETFKKLNSPNVILLMMGDGHLRAKCESICNNPNIVRYLGYQPGTLEYLQVSDYLISSSYSEGFPTAVLEAMSVGVAPILSNIEPHAEMLKGVPNACMFNPNSEDELLNILRKEKPKYDYREYFRNNFSSRIMYEKHFEIYQHLVSR